MGCTCSIIVLLPSSGRTQTELGLVSLTSGNEAERGIKTGVQPQGNLQCSFSRVIFLITVPRAKALWLCPAVPISGGMVRRVRWVSNYQSYIDKFEIFNLVLLSELRQSSENRTGEITKDFAVLYSF